ncbi:MAG: multiprotein bridging factor aMBF1 [Candidatus Woesearchaeota archaeon]
MICEMCGKNLDNSLVVKARVEGTVLNVCENCAKYGQILSKTIPEKVISKPILNDASSVVNNDSEEVVVDNFSEIIKKSRELKGITQEEFAKKINEKESLIHKIETGHITPNFKLAKKIEQFLNIKLLEEIKFSEYKDFSKKSVSNELTIGDVIKIKKVKK